MENVTHHKTTMCKYYMQNEPCRNRACSFAHGMRELFRRVPSRIPSLKESPSFRRSHALSSESFPSCECAKCERMLMQPCKRRRPSPPPYHRAAHDRLEIDKRHISRHVERSQYNPRRPTEEIPHINNPNSRYSTGHSNHDSHCQNLRVMLQSQSRDIRKSPDVVEPRFPPGFEPIVKNPSPPNKDVHDDRDETPPNTNRVEEGEILSTISKHIHSAIFGCIQQEDYEQDDDEARPLCVTRESTNNVGGPDVGITKYDLKGDDIEGPIHVTEGLTKDVAELQVKNTDCNNLSLIKESARDGDDQKPLATHEVPPIDDNDVEVNSSIPQVNNGTRHHEVLENSFEDEVFHSMGNTEMVKDIIDAWREYTCTRVRLEEVKQEEHKQIQKLDDLVSLLVKDHMNVKENE